MQSVATVAAFLKQLASPELAFDGDNVGLLLGDPAAEVSRLMTCLTVTPESAAEAVDEGIQLVVSHHPILFRAVQRLTAETAQGRTLLALARAGVAVYSPHSAFDNAAGGINEWLADRLGLVEVAPLRPRAAGRSKVVVFVPDADLSRVADAMFAAGAGHIGSYSQCSFRLAGTGTFFGSDETNPAVGQRGRREEVSEWRLEAVCPEERVDAVVRALRRAHSYEEPAYDVYPLRPAASGRGEGRTGRLASPATLAAWARQVKEVVRAGCVQTVGDPARRIERVAVACGAGGTFLRDAVRARADVFLTGELRFHDYLAAEADGLALVLPGHYASERVGVEALAERLGREWPDLEVWASRRERDPLAVV